LQKPYTPRSEEIDWRNDPVLFLMPRFALQDSIRCQVKSCRGIAGGSLSILKKRLETDEAGLGMQIRLCDFDIVYFHCTDREVIESSGFEVDIDFWRCGLSN
jgi:hypothetical protein